jgi:fumarylacetoacetase
MLDASHHPDLNSWVASANTGHTDFPVQNLPYARLRPAGSDAPWRIGVAIGDQVLDLAAAAAAPAGWNDAEAAALAPLARGDLKGFMARGPAAWQTLRLALSRVLSQGSAAQAVLAPGLLAQDAVEFSLPCEIGDYTDFYTGIHHATTVGKLFRPDNPLLPNYQWVPIGYHGRSSSIGISGHTFARPWGQLKGPQDEQPRYAPSQRLDHELELGVLIGQGNAPGQPVSMDKAESHIFGLTLLNDWSARDVQAWEYQPLGPFLAKNFATTLSPWVVTMAALAPFRAPFERPAGDPQPLPYLDSAANRAQGLLNITLEACLLTPKMRAAGAGPQTLSQANYRDAAYWTLAQLVSHHTANGCNLRPGDLFGTGTLSGLQPDQAGSLLELSQGGKSPITLANGETRTFLQDGDTLILQAWCEQPGARRIGLGTCAGTVAPARPQPAAVQG